MEDVYAAQWRPRDIIGRRTVALGEYPDMVVMYLGMRVNSPRGILTIMRFGRALHKAMGEAWPPGLLHHERMLFSLRQVGWRQYWRDMDSLVAWARASPHRDWWLDFLKNPRGAGLWHETYFMRGGMEAVFDEMPSPIGLSAFAPIVPAEGTMFAQRLAKPAAAPPRGHDEEPGRGE